MTRLLGHCQEAWLVLLLANIELLPRTEKKYSNFTPKNVFDNIPVHLDCLCVYRWLIS